MPGKNPAVCNSLVELIDLYPTVSSLCGLDVPDRLQGIDISRMLDDPNHQVRDTAFSVAPMRDGFLLREHDYAYIQYGEDAAGGIELFDMRTDPLQLTNLSNNPDYRPVVARLRAKMVAKLDTIRDNDLPIRGLGRNNKR